MGRIHRPLHRSTAQTNHGSPRSSRAGIPFLSRRHASRESLYKRPHGSRRAARCSIPSLLVPLRQIHSLTQTRSGGLLRLRQKTAARSRQYSRPRVLPLRLAKMTKQKGRKPHMLNEQTLDTLNAMKLFGMARSFAEKIQHPQSTELSHADRKSTRLNSSHLGI